MRYGNRVISPSEIGWIRETHDSFRNPRVLACAFVTLPRLSGVLLAGVLLLARGFAANPVFAGPVEDAIRERVERMASARTFALGSTPIFAKALLPRLYERRGYHTAWNRERLDALIGAVDGVARDGLVPSDYHEAALRKSRIAFDTEATRSTDAVADRDLIATDALVCVAYHLSFGKVDPFRLDSKWNFPRTLNRHEATEALLRVLDSGDISHFLDGLRPRHPYYGYLRRELASYQDRVASGGWPKIPEGPTLKLGVRDHRILLLRKRLIASDDLAAAAASDTALGFDPSLENSVRSFQRRHLLADDGTVGPGTLAALNVSIGDRVNQLRVNLERARWLLHNLPDSFVVVNIAAFEAYLVAGSNRVWSTRCQVGKEGRETPVFRDTLRYIVFNPTWTVPTGILAKDVLPALRRGDLSVLQRKKLKVLDRQGRMLNPRAIQWSKVTAGNCPYTFRQDPGPDNALGRVKFMFPNPYSVYLHDTPSRDLFESPTRAFSSGCIRVDRPLELAERLLTGTKWDAAAIQRTVDSGKTVTVTLRRPLPVLLLYWTAFPSRDSRRITFAKDIYGRDAKVLRALEGGS